MVGRIARILLSKGLLDCLRRRQGNAEREGTNKQVDGYCLPQYSVHSNTPPTKTHLFFKHIHMENMEGETQLVPKLTMTKD